MRSHVLLPLLLIPLCAAPAQAGTGPRSDLEGGHLAIGADPSAFCVDLGLTDRLTIGVDGRDDASGTAWSGLGARATLRLLGKREGWNVALGGRLSVPTAQYDALWNAQVKDLAGTVGYWGAASGYVLFSLPITPWFMLRYPLGVTYYLGPGQNEGQTWSFGGMNWSPSDGRTTGLVTPAAAIYLPVLQALPEASFKLWGFEATLFGGSIAGFRLSF